MEYSLSYLKKKAVAAFEDAVEIGDIPSHLCIAKDGKIYFCQEGDPDPEGCSYKMTMVENVLNVEVL